jgi:hypothetical protein
MRSLQRRPLPNLPGDFGAQLLKEIAPRVDPVAERLALLGVADCFLQAVARAPTQVAPSLRKTAPAAAGA